MRWHASRPPADLRAVVQDMRTLAHRNVDGRVVDAPEIWRLSRQDAPIIGLDCDGVLASDRLLWQHLRRRFPDAIPPRYDDLATFEWPRATPETTALCLALSADPVFMARLDPIPQMAHTLRRLHHQGYRAYVITARPACVREATREWLRRYGVAHCVEDVICAESGQAKVPLALDVGCAAFVEDNHTTAEAMGAVGIRSYLIDAPYNQAPTRKSLRVYGWRHLHARFLRDLPATAESMAASDDAVVPVVAPVLAS